LLLKYKTMYTLKEIQSASCFGTKNQELKKVSKWCWDYVNKFTDFTTSIGVLNAWNAAYCHVENNSKYLQTNTLPR
jgi:hypothetical protein